MFAASHSRDRKQAMKHVYLLALLLLLSSPPASAAMPASETVSSTASASRLVADADTVTPGEPFWLALEIALAPGWHTYWENPGDTGLPATLTWALPEGFSAAPVHWPIPERVELAGLMNFAYSGTVYFFVPVTPPKTLNGDVYRFSLKADWLVCKDICIPERGEYALELPVVPSGRSAPDKPSHLATPLAQLPKPLDVRTRYAVKETALILTIPAAEIAAYRGRKATLFPVTEGLIDNMTEARAEWSESALTLTMKRGASTETPPLNALLAFADGEGKKAGFMLTADYAPLPAQPPSLSLWTALLLAFAGGIILNLMPCVLPVLSLKAIALVKKSAAAPREAAAHGVVYAAGIVASFTLIAGVLIVLQQAGQAVGWGFQLQSSGFVTALALVIFAVGLNLSGVFTVPHLFGGAGHSLASKHGLPGTFFTGVLAVLVATPCTAPFMAPALGFALTQPPLPAFLIFLALALGFAAPLLLVSLSPRTLRRFPKPGAWMHGFKQLMAFPMYATGAWLVVVLTEQGGVRALINVLTLLLAAAFLLWLHERLRIAAARKAYRFGVLAFGLFLAWLLIGAPGSSPELREEPYSAARLEALRAANTPVFVYATAAWCITCKLNEATSLHTGMAREHFRTRGIAVLKADWTHRDATIAEYLRSFRRQGVPLYVFYPKDGGEPKVLPQLLTPYALVEMTGGG